MNQINDLTSQIAEFDGDNLTILDHQGGLWLTAADLARALGYSRADKVSRLFHRNRDEFTDRMVAEVDLKTNESAENPTKAPETGEENLLTKTRIFSARGCHLIAMFSRTDKAKEFRKWILDLIDHHETLRTHSKKFHENPRINRAVAGYLHNIQIFNYALIQNQLFEDGIRQLYRDRDESIQGSAMFVEALEQIKHSDDPRGCAVALLQEHAEGERKMQERIADLERRIQKNNEVITAVTAEDPLLPAMFNQGTKVSMKKLAYDVWMARRLGADGEESFQLSELIK